MPWTCPSCSAAGVADDLPACSACGVTKASWTLVADRTRTFSVTSKAKAEILRAKGDECPRRDDAAAYSTLELEPAVEALSMEKAAVAQLAQEGLLPPPSQLLVVRLWPKATGDNAVYVAPAFEAKPEVEEGHPSPAPAAPGEAVSVTFLLCHGPESLSWEPPAGVVLLEVSDEVPRGHAPELGVRALSRKRTPLPIKPGIRALVWSR